MSLLGPRSFLGLDYNECTDDELQCFTDNRAPRVGVDLPRSREECLSVLSELDANATF